MSSPTPVLRNEDWLAVGLAGVVILLVLAGVRPAVPASAWSTGGDLTSNVLTPANLGRAVVIGAGYLLLATAAVARLGGHVGRFIAGFPVVFVIAWLSQVVAGNAGVRYWGFEYVIFALVIGLVISNVFGTPGWLIEAVRTELYIKTGLVLLGAGILFFEILQAGALGILQAVLVVIVVWYLCFWLARRLRVDDELGVMLATAVSICGVSAAIAACGAIQGDKKKLSYVTSLVLIVAVPMMVLMPMVSRMAGIPDIVAGAWMGGTLDTSGSVVAAGALISDTAMKAGTIVKFSQNVLLGVAAFLLAIWWSTRESAHTGTRPTLGVIWERFPKFVIGFLVASMLFSFVIDPQVVNETKSLLAGLRTFWLALAFVSIGLETRLTDLLSFGEGRPLTAFLLAQGFNLVWTLLLAFLIFGGWFVAVPFT